MKGLSITAIGMRSIEDCLNIFHTLKQPLRLDFLELAIGSNCDVNFDYQDIPLVLHDSCLYNRNLRYKLNLLQPETWKPVKLVRAIKDVENVPGGIFSYSGDGYFAALLKAGLVTEIVDAFPDFASRYTSPSNQNPSYSVAVDMLLSGEIDFVFNARPLTPTEYAKAKLQNIQLQETPIAVDGIVFYTHPELTVSKITIKELMGIFQGRIKNWKQLGGEDLAITSVILSKENVEALGFEVNDNANINYAPNHTLAVREVIDTPGAIGYASASLVQNQSLLKFLTLGQSSVVNPSVINYVSPFLSDGEANSEAFSQGTYPLVRRLTLVNTNRPNSEAAGTAIRQSLALRDR